MKLDWQCDHKYYNVATVGVRECNSVHYMVNNTGKCTKTSQFLGSQKSHSKYLLFQKQTSKEVFLLKAYLIS